MTINSSNNDNQPNNQTTEYTMNELTEVLLVTVSVYWPILLGIIAAPIAIVANLTGHIGLAAIAVLLGGMLGAVMLDRTLKQVTTP